MTGAEPVGCTYREDLSRHITISLLAVARACYESWKIMPLLTSKYRAFVYPDWHDDAAKVM
jgi:hypothetical protein